MQINFTIVIPHKNITDLLQRCIDSIPQRDDTQVIIVDDNSDPQKVDFNMFPGTDRPDVEVVYTKESKGAGYARNIGLSRAEGKWVIFIDADDLFSSSISEILDSAIDSTADLQMYGIRSVFSDELDKPSLKGRQLEDYFDDYFNGKTGEDTIRYRFNPTHGKIIKRDFIIQNHIRFSETPWCDDMFFSIQIGYNAKRITVSPEVLYVFTERSGSLTSHFAGTFEEFRVELSESLKSEDYLKDRGISLPHFEPECLMEYVLRSYGWSKFIRYFLSQKPLSKLQCRMFRHIVWKFEKKIGTVKNLF